MKQYTFYTFNKKLALCEYQCIYLYSAVKKFAKDLNLFRRRVDQRNFWSETPYTGEFQHIKKSEARCVREDFAVEINNTYIYIRLFTGEQK